MVRKSMIHIIQNVSIKICFQVAKGEPPQQPICVLNIVLPEEIIPETGVLDHDLHKYSFIKDSSK